MSEYATKYLRDGMTPRALKDVSELLASFPGGIEPPPTTAGNKTGKAAAAGEEPLEESGEVLVDVEAGAGVVAAGAAEVGAEAGVEAGVEAGIAEAGIAEAAAGAAAEAAAEAREEAVEHGWRRRHHATEPANQHGRGAGKLALVFGREAGAPVHVDPP